MSWLTVLWLLSHNPVGTFTLPCPEPDVVTLDPLILYLNAPSEPDPRAWRVIDTPNVHLGVRPHGDEGEAAITVQLTATAISL